MKPSFYRMILLLSYGLLTCTFSATAQVTVQWDKTIGGSRDERLSNAISTPDGGYLLAGHSSSPVSGDKSEGSKGSSDFWIVKIDETGHKQWDKTIGGSLEESLSSAISTPDGGYLLAGSSRSDASGDKSEDNKGSKGGNDFWIVKIDEHGNKQWDKTFGGSGSDVLRKSINTPDGGYLLAGHSSSPVSGDKSEGSKGRADYWIVKIDEHGNKQWDKTFGGNEYDFLYSAISTPDGGYLLAGDSNSPASGDKSKDNQGSKGPADFWIVKIDKHGNKQWDKTIGGSGYETPRSAISTPDGGYLLAGWSSSPASGDKSEGSKGGTDFWIVKIDEHGNKQWDKTFGGSDFDYIFSIPPTADGGYLLAGISLSDASGDKSEDSKGRADFWIVKIDEHGNKQWDKTFGGNEYDFLYSAISTPDGGYLLAGDSSSPASGDKSEDSMEYDFWIVKVIETEEDFSVSSLSLVNADTDKVLFSLQDGAVINLSDLGNPRLTIRVNTAPINVGRVSFELSGPISHTQTENYWPYALFGDDPDGPRDYIGKQWKPGEYRLTVTPYLNDRKGSTVSISFQVVDDVSAFVAFFVLVNADTDQDIRILTDGDVIDLQALGNPQLSIRANTKPFDVGRIELSLSGSFSHTQTEKFWPYALFGDEPDGPRDYIGRDWQAGNYTLTATPYLNDQRGATATISFSVTGSSSNARLAAEVYPVPTTGEITITHEGTAEEAQLMLLDFAGNVVLEQPLSRQAQQLDLSSFKKGFYYLKIIQQQQVQVKRIVLE